MEREEKWQLIAGGVLNIEREVETSREDTSHFNYLAEYGGGGGGGAPVEYLMAVPFTWVVPFDPFI